MIQIETTPEPETAPEPRFGNRIGYNDELRDMTFGRRLARYLSKYNWYYPKQKISEGDNSPSLDGAWEYFEHNVLKRYCVDKNENPKGDGFLQAAVGENDVKTRIYPLLCPERELADWGIGVGMYFSRLRYLSGVFLVAFLIQLPLYQYYRDESYNGISTFKGSAACINQVWKPCPTCIETDFEGSRFMEVQRETSASPLVFVKVNDCSVDFNHILFSWIACIFVLGSMLVMTLHERYKAIKLDEIQQTASDYSIKISNPPKDARDPDEWKAFFAQVCEEAQVTFVTIALDNEDLIKALVARKEAVLQIDQKLPQEIEMNEDNLMEIVKQIPPLPWWKTIISPSAEAVYEKIIALDESIEKLQKKNFDVTHIFVTFETEEDQRKVLTKLSLGVLPMLRQRKESLPSECLFRGEKVLKVSEPAEPSSIRWQNLDESVGQMLFQRITTLILSLILILGGGIAITLCQRSGDGTFLGFTAASFMITFFNTLTPRVVAYLMTFEAHRNQGSLQESLFLKMCLFRWVNTAVILYVTTPFTSILTGTDLLTSVFSVFTTEIYTTPILNLSDIFGQVQRHYFAPRAKDQRQMNQCFTGVKYNLAERYTDMSKVVFNAFFYAAIFPAGFLFASISLFVHYCVNKYCLLRIWALAPKVGTELTKITNKFNMISVLVYVFMTSYLWFGFPFHNVCEYDGDDSMDLLSAYVGEHKISGHTFNVSNDDTVYKYCSQDLIRSSFKFPSLSKYQPEPGWMSPDVARIVDIFAWTSIAVLIVALLFLLKVVPRKVYGFFYSIYKPSGKTGKEYFSSLHEAKAYIPQIDVPGYDYPFLLCDVRGLDEKYIGWKIKDNNYDKNNLIYDVPCLRESKDEELDVQTSIFSIVKFWAPPSCPNED